MKKQFWNLRFGNNLGKTFGKKGFIFALDAAMAVIVAMILLIASHYYIIKSEEDNLAKLQIIKIGSDMITLLDNQNLFPFTNENELSEEENKENLENELESLLPKNYDMKIEIDHKCECSSDVSYPSCSALKENKICENTFPVGNEIPNNAFVASGHRFFVKIATIEFNDEIYPNTFFYGKVRYWVWLK